MEKVEAYEILLEYQNWRRGVGAYGDLENYKPLELSPQQIGDALDVAIKHLGSDYLMDKLEENGM